MAKDDQQEAFEKLMSANLTRVLDLVKFAEAKNAALLAFASAWIVASINMLSSGRQLDNDVADAMTGAVPLWGLSAAVAVWSLLPKVNLKAMLKDTPLGPPNLLFFGDIAKKNAEDYRRDVAQRYTPTEAHTATSEYLADLSDQVAAVSRIAARKYRLFNVGASLALAALAVIAAPHVVNLLERVWS